jgi:hypothetical protein
MVDELAPGPPPRRFAAPLAPDPPTDDPPPPTDVGRRPSFVLAALAAGAGVIHLALVPDHAAEWLALGVAFAVVGWAQLLLALGLVTRPSRRLRAAGAALSLAVVGAWAYTRVIGWPVGPQHGTTEAAHFVDGLAAALELAFAAGVAWGAAVPGTGDGARGRRSGVRTVLVAATSALAVLGLTTAALADPSTAEHHHDDAAADPTAAATAGHDHAAADPTAAATAGHDHAAADPTAAATGTTAATAGHDHPAAASGTTAATAGHDHPAAATGTSTGAASAPAHAHAACTAPVTAEQQAAADALVARTRAAIAPDADLATAMAAGYRPITPPTAQVVHYGDPAYLHDGAVLDPARPESLVYAFSADHRTAYLLGAMYLMDDPTATPPDPGGCETLWHDHTNLCLAPGVGMVGTVAADGSCPAGSTNATTTLMMHVWSIDVPAGPFSELDASTRHDLVTAVAAAVRAGTLAASPVPA